MDTTKFDTQSELEYKRQARSNWTDSPCGANYSNAEVYTEAFFRETADFRYRSHPWILEDIRCIDLEDKRVLEIGFGTGADHLALSEAGADTFGIDLSATHAEMTRARFDTNGRTSCLALADGEKLPFADRSFDFVYSFGAVHHSPDTAAIVDEIHRVLKPGGACHLTVYNKRSVFFWWSILLVNFVWRRGYRKRSLQQQLSLIEYPNKNPDIVVRLYTRKQVGHLFAAFSKNKVKVRHLLPSDIEYFSRFFSDPYRPRRSLDAVGRALGWYLVIDATK